MVIPKLQSKRYWTYCRHLASLRDTTLSREPTHPDAVIISRISASERVDMLKHTLLSSKKAHHCKNVCAYCHSWCLPKQGHVVTKMQVQKTYCRILTLSKISFHQMAKHSRMEQNGILALNEHVNVIGCLKQNTIQQVHFSCLVHAWQSFQQMP